MKRWSFALLVMSSPAVAQYGGYAAGPNPGIMAMQWEHGKAIGEQATDQVDLDVQNDSTSTSSSVNLVFNSSRERTTANMSEFLSRTRERNAGTAAELAQLFSSVDVVGEVGKAMRGYGLDPNNVADAYAVWWVSAWSAANGVESPSDAVTYRAVQRQARAAFSATRNFANTSDADRQQFAEAMMVQAVLLDSANDGLRGSNPEGMKLLAQNTRKGAKEMGLDLDTMVLTREGFKPREGADASEVIGGEGAPALAASESAEGNTPTYLAIAAAATLGLGGAFWLGKRSS